MMITRTVQTKSSRSMITTAAPWPAHICGKSWRRCKCRKSKTNGLTTEKTENSKKKSYSDRIYRIDRIKKKLLLPVLLILQILPRNSPLGPLRGEQAKLARKV